MIKVYIDFPSLFWEGTFYQITHLGFFKAFVFL